jgi:hypothetical protein
MRLSIQKNLLQLKNASVVALPRAKSDLVTQTLRTTAYIMMTLTTMKSLRLRNLTPRTMAGVESAARVKVASIAREPPVLVAVPVANLRKKMKKQKLDDYFPRLKVALLGLLDFKTMLLSVRKSGIPSLKFWSKPG